MNKVIPLLAFSVLFLVPVGSQNVFAGPAECAGMPDGAICGDTNSAECNLPDSCLNEVCVSNIQPAGTLCGDPTSTQCDFPDTCDGNGFCETNITPYGTQCDEGFAQDGNFCNSICDGIGLCLDEDDFFGDELALLINTNGKSCDADGISCTADICESLACIPGTPNNSFCDDGDLCNGAETCDPNLDCVADASPNIPACFPSDGNDNLVAGEIIPIESTNLLLAGAQSSLIWLLPVVIAGVGLAAFKLRNKI